MESALQQSETGMIQQTALEKLVQRAQKEAEIERRRQEVAKAKQELGQRTEDLIRRIFSVYFFIRTKIGLPHLAITEEEFEAAETQLIKIAEEKVNKSILKRVAISIWNFIITHTKEEKRLVWKHFLENEYFPDNARVFQRKFDLSDSYVCYRIKNNCSTEYSKSYPYTIPPNIKELFSSLSQKRLGSLMQELAQHEQEAQ